MKILLVLLLVYVFWLAYVLAMAAKWQWHTLPTGAKWLISPVIAVGIVLDIAIQFTLASVIFVDPPRELTVTQRLDRYLTAGGWRKPMAVWICKTLLNPFAVSGRHCSE